jgi:hypothetical protein
MYSENYSDEYSDNDQSLNQMDRSPVRFSFRNKNHNLFICYNI